MDGQIHQQIGFQAHRADVDTLGATDAVTHGFAHGLGAWDEQDAGATLHHRHIVRDHRTPHHGATTDNLTRVFGDAASGFDQGADRRTDAGYEVRWLHDTLACDGDDALDERLILLHGLVDGEDGAHVLHHGADRDGQRAALHLTADHGVDELLLAPLRVTHLERHHLDALLLGGQLLHQLDGVGLVAFNADHGAANVDGGHEDLHPDDDFFAFGQHQRVVRRQIRLALDGVNDQYLGLAARGRRELDLRGEGGATHTDDAGGGDLPDDLFGGQRAVADEGLTAVDGLFPFVALDVDVDCGLGQTSGVEHGVDLGHGARNGRVYVGRNEPCGLADQRPDLHLVAFGHHRLSRCTDVLPERYDHLGRGRDRLDRAPGR